MQILLFIPVIVGIAAIKKHGFSAYIFFLMFMMSVCGLGFYYNNLFRLGSIFPSDLYLAVFVAVWLIQNKGVIPCERNTITALCAVVSFEFIQGMFCQYDSGEILTDFKYVLYFFVPYYYEKTIRDDKSKMSGVFVVYIMAIIVALILNWYNFLTNGVSALRTLGETRIIRTFAIGLGFSCGALLTCLLIVYKREFTKRTNILLYYIIQIILIASCVASYTRTNWISYGITVALTLLFVKEKKELNINQVIKTILNIGVILMILIIISQLLDKYLPGFIDTIMLRFDSIGNSVNASANVENNTFEARINDVLAGIDVFFSPRIMLGYGYGALYQAANGDYYSGAENSFVYYLWKYGLICGLYLFYRVSKKLRRIWREGGKANKVVVIYSLVQLVIGSLSGHYNTAYALAVISIIMEMNLDILFEVKEGID